MAIMISILLQFTLIQVSCACPGGAVIIGSACYWVTPTQNKATDNAVLCAGGGGGLALIPNQVVTDAIIAYRSGLSHQSEEYYLGYYDRSSDGSYVEGWTGGIQQWTNWWSSQPNGVYQECVTIYGSNGQWYDESCDNSYFGLCSNDTSLLSETTTSETTSQLTTVIDISTTSESTTEITTAPDTTTHGNIQQSSSTITTTVNSIPETSTCSCECVQTPAVVITANMTEEIQELVEKLKKELTLDKKSLSSATRKLISAKDSRPSATAVGTLGIVLLTFIFGGLLVQDVPTLYIELKRLLFGK